MDKELHFVSTRHSAVVALERVPVAMVTHVYGVHDAVSERQLTEVALVQFFVGGFPGGGREKLRLGHLAVGRGDVRHRGVAGGQGDGQGGFHRHQGLGRVAVVLVLGQRRHLHWSSQRRHHLPWSSDSNSAQRTRHAQDVRHWRSGLSW